jgi:hypothetical protein
VETKPVAVIEFVLKLLWGLSAGEQRPSQVILDSGTSTGAKSVAAGRRRV